MSAPGRTASAVGAASALLGLLAVGLHLGPGVAAPDGTTDFFATNAVTAVSFGLSGALILRSRPGHAVGRLVLAIALGHAVTGVGREVGVLLVDRGHSELGGVGLWLGSWAWAVTLWFPLLLLLLPDGRPPGLRWRWVVRAAGFLPVPLALTAALSPGPLLLEPLAGGATPDNPIGGVDLGPLPLVSFVLFVPLMVAALVAVALRFRQGGQVRDQMKWVLLAGAVVAVGVPLDVVRPHLAPVVAPVVIVVFGLAIGLAVVRHRLLDVDVVIHRTILYAGLTAVLAGIYVATVTALGQAVSGGGGSVLPGLVASGLVAAVAAPLRSSLQRGAARLFYGERDDPYAVLRRLGEALEAPTSDDGLLERLAATIARGLRLPFVAIRLEGEHGSSPDGVVQLPLVHRGELVGALLLLPRAPGERLSEADERLLTELARQAAVAAHGVVLTASLRAARNDLVRAREEERLRLRRDLHDGLGPLLAAATVQLDAARRMGGDSPDRLADVLLEVRTEIQQAVADVRRLVDDLRPPALDELGLVSSLRALGARLVGAGFEVVGAEIELPAAVEVAAYRIASEALTNAARHAPESRVRLRVALEDGAVVVAVRDHGPGGAAPRAGGVGLASMAERAAELGGSVVVADAPGGGTEVIARLPLAATYPAAGAQLVLAGGDA